MSVQVRRRNRSYRRPPLLPRPTRRGLSQVEVVMSTLFVMLTLSAAMHSFGVVLRSRTGTSSQARGRLLAQQLATEILSHHYLDPGGSPEFGVESSEVSFDRASFNDVDDFDGWSAAPPEDRDGNSLDQTDGWSRQVSVAWVERDDPTVTSATDQGVKRITVAVAYLGQMMHELVVLRSDGDS